MTTGRPDRYRKMKSTTWEKETTTDIHSHAVFEAGKKPVLFKSEKTKDRSESFIDKESTSGGLNFTASLIKQEYAEKPSTR